MLEEDEISSPVLVGMAEKLNKGFAVATQTENLGAVVGKGFGSGPTFLKFIFSFAFP